MTSVHLFPITISIWRLRWESIGEGSDFCFFFSTLFLLSFSAPAGPSLGSFFSLVFLLIVNELCDYIILYLYLLTDLMIYGYLCYDMYDFMNCIHGFLSLNINSWRGGGRGLFSFFFEALRVGDRS
ncbi:hypothetical protein DFH27DRAFT_585438 [Peziza echinospora]|nr:hypothetical protein DFH27DRAFT_585438 [Peziza echinospora]